MKTLHTPGNDQISKVLYDEKQKSMIVIFTDRPSVEFEGVPVRLWKIMQLYVECEGNVYFFFNEYIKGQFAEVEPINP